MTTRRWLFGSNSRIVFTAREAGTFFVVVGDNNASGPGRLPADRRLTRSRPPLSSAAPDITGVSACAGHRLHPNAARRSGRRRGGQPQAAGPRRLRPPAHGRRLLAAAARLARLLEDHARSSARRWMRSAARSSCSPRSTRARSGSAPDAGDDGRDLFQLRTGAAASRARHDPRGDLRDDRHGADVATGSCRRSGTRSRRSSATKPRPKSGLLRVREFTMKDSYSSTSRPAGSTSVRAALRGLPQDLRALRARRDRRGGLVGRHGRQRIDRVHGAERCGRGLGRCLAAPAATRRTSRRPPRCSPALEDGPGPAAAGDVRDAGPAHDRADLASFEGGAPAERQIKTLVYVVGGRS